MDPDLETDLRLHRTFDVPRDVVWECWTTPAHFPHFFVPKPHKNTACDIDLRTGGRFNTIFDVGGAKIENQGVFPEVVGGKKLLFKDT
jgi:uncharacterized protein YndB with AHSA1/START domain